MTAIHYWPERQRLVYLDESATPEFWDRYWESVGEPPPVNPRDYVILTTSGYLDPGARVLEGGCGRANKVKALADAGFEATGVDFAEKSVEHARKYYPGLDIRKDDVRDLSFPDGTFDGIWSIGVIEHFWSGYGDILAEAARVLRDGGYLFLTAPWFSPTRRLRARSGHYPVTHFDEEPGSFYQFALSRSEVERELTNRGFRLVEWRGIAGEIFLQRDVPSLSRAANWLFASRGSILKRAARKAIVTALNPLAGHSFLAVAQNVANGR